MAAERIEHLLFAAYPQSRELFEGAGEWLEREIGQYIMSRRYDLDAPETLTKKFLSSIQGQFRTLRAPHQEAFKSWLTEFSAGDFADQSQARTTALSQLASLLEASGRYTEPAQPPTAHRAPTAASPVPATGPSASASTTPSGAQQRAPRVEESSTASKPERTVFVVELECTDRALFELLAAALGKTVVGASTTVLETDCDALSYQLQLHSNGHTAYQQAGRRSQVPSLFGRVCVQQPARKSSGEDIPPSFDKPFEYDYFPAEMLSVSVACALKYERLISAFDARSKNSAVAAQMVAKFMKENNLSTKLRLTLVSSVGTRLTGGEEEEQRTLAARFCRYLRWCQSPKRRRFAFVEAAAIDRALARVKEEMIGVETLIEREMGPLMKEFAHVDASMPHGVLLYGPPGTGKTTIIDKLMLYMDIVPVCPAMAAGDFNKPYRGEGEAMVKHLGERAAAVPWQAVGVSIDEIDGLAPQRGESDSGGKVDLLSVLLSVVGGNQDVKNLILFGSTNRFASMDEAFRRRMGKKFFVGRPSFEARRKWMLWKMCQYALPIGCMEVLNVVRDVRQRLGLNSPDDLDRLDRQPALVLPTICSMRLPPATEEQLTWLQSLTINFSNDAMRVLLSSMHIARCSAGLSNAKHPFERNELQWFAEQVAKAERIFLGNDVVPDLFADSVNAISTGAEQYERLRELKDHAKGGVVGQPDTPLCGREFRATRFMLVDSGSQPSSQIQVQFVTGGHNNLERNNLIAALRQAFPPAQAITPEQMCATLGLFVQQHLTKEECVALQKACSWRNLVTVGDLAEKIIQLTRVIHACYVTDPHYWRGGKANERILGELGRPSPFVTGAAWQIWQSAPERIQESRRHVFEAIEHVRQFGTMTRTSTGIGISTGFGNFFALPAPPLFDVRDQLNRTYDFNDAVASEARALREAVRVLLARVEDTTARFYMVDHYGPLCASLLTRQEIMFVLTDLAINLKLEALYVVDSETLVRNRTVSDEEAQMYLHMVSDEARQYASSMVIVDLQSLVSPSKSYDAMTNDSTRSSLALERRVSAAPAGATDDEREARKLDDEAGPAFRYELTRPGVLAMVQRMVQQQTSVDTPHWLVVLTEDLYLTSRVKQCFYEHQWPLTPEEEQTRERNREMRRRRTCVVCHEEYTEEENSARMACSRHTGQLRLEYVYKGKTEHLQFSTAAAFDRKMAELSQMEPPPEVKDARWFCCGNRPHDRGERPARHTDACGESHPDQARDGKQFCVSCGQKLK